MYKLYLSIFALGLLIRVCLFTLTWPGADIANFKDTAAIANAGGNVYREQYYYNYSPVPALIVSLLARLPFPFADTFRVFVAVCDLVNAVLISRLVTWKTGAFAIVWLSPPLMLFGAWDAQFEALTLTPLLIALTLVRCWSSAPSRSAVS